MRWKQGYDNDLLLCSDTSLDQMPAPTGMSSEAATAVGIENSRRQQAKSIWNLLNNFNASYQHTISRIVGNDQHGSPTAPIEDDNAMFGAPGSYKYPRYTPPCPRHALIRQYLFENRQELALDTLYFEIPEHLLLAYIIRSGFEMQPWEFRGFLLGCQASGELFKYVSL